MVVRQARVKYGTKRRMLSAAAFGEFFMRELRRTNDLVWLSMAEALLKGEGLTPVILDAGISAVEGGIGAFPRRLMITESEEALARRLLQDLDSAYEPA
jgi:hypothetical protein